MLEGVKFFIATQFNNVIIKYMFLFINPYDDDDQF